MPVPTQQVVSPPVVQPQAVTAQQQVQPVRKFRTDRNNNPTAMTTDVARTLGLQEGVDYTVGDKFPGDSPYYTAKLLGDPIATTTKAIDLAATTPGKQAFYTASGKPRWVHTALTNEQWNSLDDAGKKDVIAKMYQHEGGSGELLKKTAPGSLTMGQLGMKIKQKYPQYAGMSDEEVAQRVIAKYPQYSNYVKHGATQRQQEQSAPENKNFLDKAGEAVGAVTGAIAKGVEATGLSKLVGGIVGTAGEVIGSGVGTIGNMIKTHDLNPFSEQNMRAAEENAKGTGQFGYDIGKQGAEAAPSAYLMGGLGRIPNAALGGIQAYQAGKELSTAKTPEEYAQGTADAALAAWGLKGAAATKGNIINKEGFLARPPSSKAQPRVLTNIANKYEEIIRPSKSEYRNMEIKQGKEMSDITKRIAEEAPVFNDGGVDAGKKQPILDTQDAAKHMQERGLEIKAEIKPMLETNTEKRFDLKAIGEQVKKSLSKTVTNAKELEQNHAEVDKYIDAEIASHGQVVDGATADSIKSGMWSVSYDRNVPNSKVIARRIGNALKTSIEDAYPEFPIAELNKIQGQYYSASDLLQNAHGRVVNGGKIGRYKADIVGGATGAIAGHIVPGAGPLVGGYVGAKTADALYMRANDPVRLTTELRKQRLKLQHPTDVEAAIQKGREALAKVQAKNATNEFADKYGLPAPGQNLEAAPITLSAPKEAPSKASYSTEEMMQMYPGFGGRPVQFRPGQLALPEPPIKLPPANTESFVKSVRAEKLLPQRDPRTGRMQTIYSSQPGYGIDEQKAFISKPPEIEGKIMNLEQHNLDKVYRTEKADKAYKGKAVWGDGKYFSLDKRQAKEMTTSPHTGASTGGTVDIYSVPKNAKIKTFDISDEGMTPSEFNAFPRGNDLRKKILDEGYDGVILKTGGDLNYGGDQLIMYKNVESVIKQQKSSPVKKSSVVKVVKRVPVKSK